MQPQGERDQRQVLRQGTGSDGRHCEAGLQGARRRYVPSAFSRSVPPLIPASNHNPCILYILPVCCTRTSLDGTIKKKGKSYKLDKTETETQATQAATDTLLNSSASQTLPPAPPSSPMTVVSSAAPNAPRKNTTIMGKMDIPTDAVSAGSTHLADDIEESFNDDKQDEGKGKSAGQVGTRKQLTLAKSNSSAALSAQVAVLPVENRKRPLQVDASMSSARITFDSSSHPLIPPSSHPLIPSLIPQDDEEVNFSQTSEISETGETGTKRAKKFSVIRDPIYLNANVPGGRQGMSVME
jgi:hypothetical protein